MWTRSEWYSTASTMSTHHYFTSPSPDNPNLSQLLGQNSSVRVHPCAHPQHMNNTFYEYNMDVDKEWVVFYSFNHVNTWLFHPTILRLPESGSAWPALSHCKGAPTCLSTAYECAQTLFINTYWCGQEPGGILQPQSCQHIIISPHHPQITQIWVNFLASSTAV